MPRIQVLHLPAPADEYPFVLVIDDVKDPAGFSGDGVKAATGAVGVLVFADKVEVL